MDTLSNNSGQANGLTLVVEGIYAYLREVSSYHAICRRHEGTTTVDERDGQLHVGRRFENTSETIAHFTAAADRLRHGQQPSPSGEQEPSYLVRCEIAWEGRPLVVHAHTRTPGDDLQVDLLVPPSESDLPALPLRTISEVLRCHEFLIPACIAVPVAVAEDIRGSRGIRDYLKRTMPQNLYASECI